MASYVRPDPTSSALLTIDVQRDFTDEGAPAEIEGTRAAVPGMRDVVEAFRADGAPIVHVVRLYRGDGSNVDACRRRAIEEGAEIVRPGTAGAEVVPELTPEGAGPLDPEELLAGEFQRLGPREWAMYKPRWSAFYGTTLDDRLQALGIDTVVVCGCNFPNCPRTTIYDASARDYRIGVVPDATSRTYDRGIAELEDIGVRVFESVDDARRWIATDD